MIDIVRRDNIYVISEGDRTVEITEEMLKKLKKMYCANPPATVNACCRRLNIPRKDFIFIKTAFGITHDDVPFTTEELEDNSVDELVDMSLEQKKDAYDVKLQEMEYKDTFKELKAYKKKEYLYELCLDSLADIPTILPSNIQPRSRLGEMKGILNLADWHVGAMADNYWRTLNLEMLKLNVEELKKAVVQDIYAFGINELYVLSLGDMIHGMIHATNRVEAEFNVVRQVKECAILMLDLLASLGKHVKIQYFNTHGNHGRIVPTKSAAIDEENFEIFVNMLIEKEMEHQENMTYHADIVDIGIIDFKIFGFQCYGVHGDKDKLSRVAGDLALAMANKPSYIFMGHLHHKVKADEFQGCEVYISRSLSGVDNYAKSIRKMNPIGQELFVFDEDGLQYIHAIKVSSKKED